MVGDVSGVGSWGLGVAAVEEVGSVGARHQLSPILRIFASYLTVVPPEGATAYFPPQGTHSSHPALTLRMLSPPGKGWMNSICWSFGVKIWMPA